MLIVAVCVSLGIFSTPAEAAGMILLPLVNNTTAEDLDATYYQKTLDALKSQNTYDLLDGDEIEKAVKKHVPEGKLPGEQQMIQLAQETGAELIVGIELDKLDYDFIPARKEETVAIAVKGNTAIYNLVSGKYQVHKILDESEIEYAKVVRGNFLMRYWGNNVSREMKRAMNVKKVTVEKPRITKF